MWSWIRGMVVVVGLILASGCAQSMQQTGVRIGDETLKQFKAGVTTEAWLVGVLGPPSSESKVEHVENTKVFRYALGEATGGVTALYSGGGKKNTAVVYFILTDGIVTRFWADREKERTLLGQQVTGPEGEKAGG